MTSHFISNIEIVDYKCFSNFRSQGFKRINLIGGKNNVGKTAFLEAIYINISGFNVSSLVQAIISVKFMRENINLLSGRPSDYRQTFLEAIKYFLIKSNLRCTSFKLINEDSIKTYLFSIDNLEKSLNANEMTFEFEPMFDKINFIDNFGWTDSELIDSFNLIQKKDKEFELNRLINQFDGNIENFKVIAGIPQCGFKGPTTSINEYRDIVEFGDGLKHFISIICALHASENSYLFIDEIDNGIHYTQLDRIWSLIFEISKATNCQVFATTHSKEMLDSFARVAKKNNEKDISYTTLVRDKSNDIKALLLDYDGLLDSLLEQGHEVR